MSSGASDGRSIALCLGNRASTASSLSFNDRSAGESAQSSNSTYNYRKGAWRIAYIDHISASGLVHGKLPVGCGCGARPGSDTEFSATARQAGAHGSYYGHWQTCD